MAPVKSRPVVPVTRSKSTMTTRSQTQNVEADNTSKRKAVSSPEKVQLKRSAFGDITNASTNQSQAKTSFDTVALTTQKLASTKLDDHLDPVKNESKNRWNLTSKVTTQETLKNYAKVVKPSTAFKVKPRADEGSERKGGKEIKETKAGGIKAYFVIEKQRTPLLSSEVAQVESAHPGANRESTSSTESSSSRPESDSSFSVFKPEILVEDTAYVDPDKTPDRKLPNGIEDFDAENWRDPFQVSIYAMDIFNYFKTLEKKFQVKDYISKQPDLTRGMRSIVVDWMVEIQENFELNHETLYLAVKMMDLFLMTTTVSKDQLQLIAAASLFIACKFDERLPPAVEDFLFICDGAYSQKDLMNMEIKIMKAIDYNLGMPLSYRFLRRYARCGRISMATLTLARFILEVSLMDYSFVSESESKMAAAALFLAQKMKLGSGWNDTLEYYSGYKVEALKGIAYRLNAMLHKPTPSLQTIRNKYSHKIFFEVAKQPLLEELDI